MEQNEKYFNDLTEVRKLMENSSKFISLSGLSGILAGVYALVGLYLVKDYILGFQEYEHYRSGDLWYIVHTHSYLFVVAFAVVTLSVLTGIILTVRKAKQKGQKILDKIAIKMIVNLSIPVIAGGAFMLLLIDKGYYDILVSAMLIFYGLGLINGSKYTLKTIRNLGLAQIALGILAGLIPEYDYFLWALGFGVLHIAYGTIMWFKYERNSQS
jgi:hypothetical protein